MPMTVPTLLTLEDYLELEKVSDIRHEFVDGIMVAIAGGKRRHHAIVLRLVELLLQKARQQGCELAAEGVKIRTKASRVRYPDVVVSCSPGDDEYFLENPCLIVEVLSDSTKATDFTAKLDEYKKLPTLERYVVLTQDERVAVLYKRVGDHWEVETLNGEGEIAIPCLSTSVYLEQVYEFLD